MDENKDFNTTVDNDDSVIDSKVGSFKKKKKSNFALYAISLLVATGLIGAVLYNLEKQGRSKTNIFSSLIKKQNQLAAVSVVNGKKISKEELDKSINRMLAGSKFSNFDELQPELKDQVKKQALDVLINTELVRQEIKNKNIEVSEEDLKNRITEIEKEVGGADVLEEEMKKFGLDKSQFETEVKEELAFKQLLNPLLTDEALLVTDEDVEKAYSDYKNNFNGDKKDLQPLSEVREAIRQQIESYKEQKIMFDYLGNLRNQAKIDINI